MRFGSGKIRVNLMKLIVATQIYAILYSFF